MSYNACSSPEGKKNNHLNKPCDVPEEEVADPCRPHSEVSLWALSLALFNMHEYIASKRVEEEDGGGCGGGGCLFTLARSRWEGATVYQMAAGCGGGRLESCGSLCVFGVLRLGCVTWKTEDRRRALEVRGHRYKMYMCNSKGTVSSGFSCNSYLQFVSEVHSHTNCVIVAGITFTSATGRV